MSTVIEKNLFKELSKTLSVQGPEGRPLSIPGPLSLCETGGFLALSQLSAVGESAGANCNHVYLLILRICVQSTSCPGKVPSIPHRQSHFEGHAQNPRNHSV